MSALITPMKAWASITRVCGSCGANGPCSVSVSAISVMPMKKACRVASVVSKRSATHTLSGTTRNASGTPVVRPKSRM